jgi:hypothetical protein
MTIDRGTDLKLLVGLGSLLHDIEHDDAAARAHELVDATVRELVSC